MVIVTVSSKGQVVLPAPIRHRLGLNPGARLLVVEELNGLRLEVLRSVPKAKIEELAGMVTARSSGRPRRLEEFDVAAMLRRKQR